MRIIFVTGGVRSGKSAYALSQAQTLPGKKAFIATARALDDEMRERIEAHKRQRNNVWNTYEEPIKIAELIDELKSRYDVILIDCLTMWLSNVMHAGLDVIQEIDKLVGATLAVAHRQGQALPLHLSQQVAGRGNPRDCPQAGASPAPAIFIVSNEVGMGIVPENPLARQFRDYQGILNQHIAGIADEVYLMVASIPVRIK
ncbi:MAG: bifunctional adenosylcobinamide kinase/adenosylcobinamide-phosphate guanylyltransferase [bacterium]